MALIDLDEGVRMMTRIVGGPARIGQRVRVAFTEIAADVTLPYFTPLD